MRKSSDYLLASYGQSGAEGLVQNHFPTTRTRPGLQYQLLKEGTIDVLDYVTVSVELDADTTLAHFTAFQFSCEIDARLLDTWPDLLSGGMWGRATLSRWNGESSDFESRPSSTEELLRLMSEPGDESPWVEGSPPRMVDFVPYQVAPDLVDFVVTRHGFSTEDWIDLLLASSGYNPEWIRAQPEGKRLTRLYLTRLLPLVERNLNVIELGPKNTGKTHLLRNLSPYVFTVSGGQATPANLFVNLVTAAPGLIQSRRVIVFDEVARLQFSRQQATVTLLKDYMESGQFSRGRASYGADTALVFMGNLEVEGNRPAPRYRHLFQVLPPELQDTAVLDRLHGFIPGWEFPKLTPEALQPGYWLSSDYFGEILLALRDLAYDEVWSHVRSKWPELPGMTRRDVKALDHVGRGLFKLVFPDGELDDGVAVELLGIAAEYRNRIHEQLVKMEPGEFLTYPIGFEHVNHVNDGRVRVETSLDKRLNSQPRMGEATAVVAMAHTGAADVVVVQVVQSQSASRTAVFSAPGLVGAELVWKNVRYFLGAHRERLGLGSSMQWAGLGVQFTGGPGDLRGHAELALALAVTSLWLQRPLPAGMAVLGGMTVTGDLTLPPDFLALVMAAANRGRNHILVPTGAPLPLLRETFSPTLYPGMQFVPVGHGWDALQYVFGP